VRRRGDRFYASFPLGVDAFSGHNRPVKTSRATAGPFRTVLAVCLLAPSACFARASFPGEAPANAQCDYWQTSDGLPHHDVVSLAQTPDGYIWLGMYGSIDSVARFNGLDFTQVFRLAGGSNAYASLAAGRDGRLWIAKGSAADALSFWQKGKLTAVGLQLPPPGDRGNPLLEDRDGNLWIGGRGLLTRAPDGRIEDRGDAMRGSGDVRQIAVAKDGSVWFATEKGPLRYRHGVFDHPYPITKSLYSIHASADGSLWMGTDAELGLLQVAPSGSMARYGADQGLSSRGISVICEDGETNIWVGTYSGLFYLKGGKAYSTRETELKTAFIFSLLWDDEGSLWVGTSDGLYHLYRNPIEQYGATAGLGAAESLGIGPSGLFASVFSRGTYLLQDGAWTKQVALEESVGDGQIIETKEGDIWTSRTSTCERFRGGKVREPQDIGGGACFCESNNTLWVVNPTNIFAFSNGTLRAMSEGWPAMNVTFVVTNGDKGFILGTTQGLYQWDGHLVRWLGLGKELAGTRINDLEWDGATLWLATDQTVACYTDHLQAIRWEAGLAKSGGINCMLVESNSLWLGCVNGLFCINRSEAEQYFRGSLHHVSLTQYGKAQGMRSGYLGPTGRGLGAVRGVDGKLCFASKSGIVAVNTRQLLNPKPPPVVIENVLLDQRAVASLRTNPDVPIRVPAGTRNVEIRYAALTYISPSVVVYKYRLQGLDSDWTPAENSRIARFTKLLPGNYEFQVQACNAAGVWNEGGASVRLVQTSFFTQTRAFTVLCWSLGGGVVVGLAAFATAVAHAISSRKMRRRLAALEAQQALDRERARIARDIHDDVGSTLTRIVLLSALAAREPDQTFTPDGHLAGICSAAREITRRLDEIVWAVNPQNDTFDSLVSYISKFLTDQTRTAGLHCHLEVPDALPTLPISGATRHNIFLACKEAIHNAIKHASAKQLQLRVTVHGGSFLLEICDDGIGLPTHAPKSAGNGLQNMRERLVASGGLCELTSGPGRGTVVGFRLPCAQASDAVSTK